VKVIPPAIQIVDKKGVVVFAVSPADDFAELTANMKPINDLALAKHAEVSASAAAKGEEAPEPPDVTLPTDAEHYRLLRNRWQLSVEIHNGQNPDDPWALQEQQDVPTP
jgi:hypothetical protein